MEDDRATGEGLSERCTRERQHLVDPQPPQEEQGGAAAQDGHRENADREKAPRDAEDECRYRLHARRYFSALIRTSMPLTPASRAVSRFGSVSPKWYGYSTFGANARAASATISGVMV